MIEPVNFIKSLYKANFYKPSSIRTKSYPQGYFMNESPLAKKAIEKKVSFSEYLANSWKNLFSILESTFWN